MLTFNLVYVDILEKTDDTTSSSTGLIGGIVGGIFAAIVVVLAFLVWRRRRGRLKNTCTMCFPMKFVKIV